MATIYTYPPLQLFAGDSFTWRESPENGSEVTVYSFIFRSIADSDVSFTITGTDEGETFLFTMDGTATTSLDGGEYSVTALITRGADGRETENHANLTLFANPANDPTKTFNQRVVELLEAHIEGRLPEGNERTEIGGVPIEKIPLSEASIMLDKYKAKVAREVNQQRIKKDPNAASGNTVHVHF